MITPHKAVGGINSDGTILIDNTDNLAFAEDVQEGLSFINGKKFSDLYYEFDNTAGINLFLIKKANLPAYLLPVAGGSP